MGQAVSCNIFSYAAEIHCEPVLTEKGATPATGNLHGDGRELCVYSGTGSFPSHAVRQYNNCKLQVTLFGASATGRTVGWDHPNSKTFLLLSVSASVLS